MMRDSELLATLQQRIRSAVVASSRPTLPIAYVDVPFTPPQDKRWLEIIRFADNNQPYLDAGTLLKGSVRLLLHWSKGGGSLAPMQLCESIAAQLPKGLRFSGISVSQAPLTGDPIQTDVDVLYPMTMKYQHLTW
jgi:hypothetical protein